MQTLDQLNQQFSQPQHISFVQQGDLLIAHLTHDQGTARIALQGAQILSWLPNGETTPVIWTSGAAVYQTGKGVRGGIPICWPWFGAGEAGKPAHGFVRTKLWQVAQTAISPAGISITLTTQDDESSRALWNHAFKLSLTMTLSDQLYIELTTQNTDTTDITITEALHTYFGIGDVDHVHVTGLAGVSYLDKVLDMTQHTQAGDVHIAGEVDRVYLNTTTETQIVDAQLNRRIVIQKDNSTSTVVWNPGSEKEKGFADMAQGDYRTMLCVESGTAGNDNVCIPAGEQHLLSVIYRIER